VLSETAAKKMTSEHLVEYDIEITPETILDKKKYQAYYPTKYSANQLEKLDNEGIAKKGIKLENGDPIAVVLRERVPSENDKILGAFADKVLRDYVDKSIVWKHKEIGEVVKVYRLGDKIRVMVKYESPMQVGDKLTGRHGNKGTVSLILPDDEMPKDEKGKPIDVLLNPLSLPSRINPSQILETVAGKAAVKAGHPIKVPLFDTEKDMTEYTKQLMKKYNIKDKEKIYIPGEGEMETPALVGYQYFIKLPQQVDKKTNTRGEYWAYDSDLQPLKGTGAGGGARSLDALTFYGMVAHNARENLREMATYKAEKNDEFWRAIENGEVPPPSTMKTPFAYEKFRAYLTGAGIYSEENKEEIKYRPITDKDVDNLAAGEVENAKILAGHNLLPEKGGLFDPHKLGGLKGDKWGKIELAEPIVNPLFEKQIAELLDLKQKDLRKIMEGKMVLKDGKLVDVNKVSPKDKAIGGGEAVKYLLSKINVDEELKKAEEHLKNSNEQRTLDKALRKVQMLKMLKENKLKPEDLVISKIPVIPPKFRPVYPSPTDKSDVRVSQINYVYQDLINLNQRFKEMKDNLSPKRAAKYRQKLLEAVGAVVGSNPPMKNSKQEEPAGALHYVAGAPGKSPKSGYFQSKVVKKRQELSGTGLIEPGADLELDEAGIPKPVALNLYKPFIKKELKKMGYDNKRITELLKDPNDMVWDIVQEEMKKRPIMLNRAPSLHKFSILSFKPRLIEGKAVQLNPLVVKGFNADFDGDTMGIHVPVTEEARKEAFKMLPSNNLLKPGTKQIMHLPSMEYLNGIFRVTEPPEKPGRKIMVKSYDELYDRFLNNQIKWNDTVEILGVDPRYRYSATAGRHLIMDVLLTIQDENLKREFYRKYIEPNKNSTWNKKMIQQLANELAIEKSKGRLLGEEINRIFSTWKDVGRFAITRIGLSVGIDDIKEEDDDVKKIKEEVDKINQLPYKQKIEKAMDLQKKLDKSLEDKRSKKYKENGLYNMSMSGAKGSIGQIRQIAATPLLVQDAKGKPAPIVVKRSFAEGLTPAEYLSVGYGARSGMIARKSMVSEPGALNKELLESLMTLVVADKDDDKDPGLKVNVDEKYIGRFLAQNIKGKKTEYKKGEEVTAEMIKDLKQSGITSIYIKSPLTSTLPEGIAAKSFGIDESYKLPEIGENIGIKSGQAVTEPLAQTSMSLFHSGSVVGAGNENIGDVFTQVSTLLRMPESNPNFAKLAERSGKVEKIVEKSSVYEVKIKDKIHKIPKRLGLVVKEGQFVKKGDKLSHGILPHKQLARLRGVPEAQKAMLNELNDIVYNQIDKKMNPQVTETIVRSVTDKAVVVDPGPYEHKLKTGDVVNWNYIDSLNRDSSMTVPLKDAIGHRLYDDTAHISKGTLIDEDIKEELEKAGIKKVTVYNDKIKYKNLLLGSAKQPTIADDFEHRMSFRYLRQTVPHSAMTGAKTKKHSYSPIAQWARGVTFGKGEKGKY